MPRAMIAAAVKRLVLETLGVIFIFYRLPIESAALPEHDLHEANGEKENQRPEDHHGDDVHRRKERLS